MVKHKVDGCKTTIKRGPGCFLIQTKLYVAIESIVRTTDYNLRLSIVNNQQIHMKRVKEALKQM